MSFLFIYSNLPDVAQNSMKLGKTSRIEKIKDKTRNQHLALLRISTK